LIYELHVTVEPRPSLSQTIDFEKHCRETLKCKCNLIELSAGTYPMQLMLAMKGEAKDDAAATNWGHLVAADLEGEGWNPVRIKVESALKRGDSVYFEAHWKVLCDTDQRMMAFNHLLQVFPEAGFLSSRNHLRDGVYYLSQRSYSRDHKIAQETFDLAAKKIELAMLNLEGSHYERVVFDSFPGLDEGWVR
jgi:hypothetical protein